MSQPARTFEDLLVWRNLNIAQGSLEELRYYFILAKDLGYADPSSERDSADEVARMLIGYTNAMIGSR